MDTVTVVGLQRAGRGRVRVLLDAGSAFSVSVPLAVEVGLHKGQSLSLAEVEALQRSDRLQVAFDTALRYLGPRPRSEAETRARLHRGGFDAGIIEETVARLREQGLVDDVAFAQFWRENREKFRPRSRRLMGLELRRKGVDGEAIAEVTAEVDDEMGAYRAAQRQARSLAALDYSAFRKRLVAFLKRGGFDYELVNSTVDRIWQEQGRAQPN
jgi:regulatory protein